MKRPALSVLFVAVVLALTAGSVAPAKVQEAQRQRWEYCYVGFGVRQPEGGRYVANIIYLTAQGPRPEPVAVSETSVYGEDLAMQLAIAKLGTEGWEMVTPWSNANSTRSREPAFFKRAMR